MISAAGVPEPVPRLGSVGEQSPEGSTVGAAGGAMRSSSRRTGVASCSAASSEFATPGRGGPGSRGRPGRVGGVAGDPEEVCIPPSLHVAGVVEELFGRRARGVRPAELADMIGVEDLLDRVVDQRDLGLVGGRAGVARVARAPRVVR